MGFELSVDDRPLQLVLDLAREKHGVLGASLAVLSEGSVFTAVSGLLNVDTGIAVTPDSAFQVGSIGKLFTATLIMQLVDEGQLDLDAKVVTYLPEFTIADGAAAARITVRQLLAHTSGIDGDFLPPDDPEGPSVQGYVRKMCLLPLLHEVGAYMTYCNSGYVVAGRIVEALRRTTWMRAVMERVCRPLGMQQAFADPAEALRLRAAMGHVPLPGKPGKLMTAPVPYPPLSIAPAGAGLSMSARDLLLFVGAHLNGGSAANGTRLLSQASTQAMREAQIDLLPFSRNGFNKMGLGWFLGQFDDYTLAGHDGATLGQWAYMQCIPDRKFAFALLTNSPSAALFEELRTQILVSCAGIRKPSEPPAEATDVDPALYAGVYENIAARVEILADGGALGLRWIPKDHKTGVPQIGRLVAFAKDCFQIEAEDPAFKGKLLFVRDDSGRPRFVRLGVRMARRVS